MSDSLNLNDTTNKEAEDTKLVEQPEDENKLENTNNEQQEENRVDEEEHEDYVLHAQDYLHLQYENRPEDEYVPLDPWQDESYEIVISSICDITFLASFNFSSDFLRLAFHYTYLVKSRFENWDASILKESISKRCYSIMVTVRRSEYPATHLPRPDCAPLFNTMAVERKTTVFGENKRSPAMSCRSSNLLLNPISRRSSRLVTPISSYNSQCPKPSPPSIRFDGQSRRHLLLLLTATTAVTAMEAPSIAADIGLFGLRKKLKAVEEEAELIVKEGFESAEKGIEAAEITIEAAEKGIEAAEKGIKTAEMEIATEVDFGFGGGLTQAGVVVGAEVVGILVGTSIVNESNDTTCEETPVKERHYSTCASITATKKRKKKDNMPEFHLQSSAAPKCRKLESTNDREEAFNLERTINKKENLKMRS
ncbi:hypothetical protein E3N88_30175 [Mikania micrantha]|uniref:Uncharacterized protein n=1 Tax=Mikania micrantha TaxID=192012 RepID=A0A5N6MLM0_9ASTR|nr:hypothetical protein E3N88_30175 [Mikania micrantha]